MEREELRETILQSCLWTFPSPKLPLHRFNLKHYAKEIKEIEERNRKLTRLSTRWDTGRPDLNSTTAAVKTKLTGNINIHFCSVAQLCLTLWSHETQYPGSPCLSPNSGVHSNLCASSWWCHPISSSVIHFSSGLQSFPASGSFQISHLITSGGQSIGVSASASVFPINIQDWFILGRTGWISLQSKGLSRVFSNTADQKYQFFSAQLSL